MEKNYSKCPLKKRPVHFTFETNDIKDEPENLCVKKDKTCPSSKNENVSIFNNQDDEEKLLRPSPSPPSPIPSVIVPTPTYPKIGLQPWNFHLPLAAAAAADFYRNIHQHHHSTQISPLRSDLHSPNSSPSEGSLSPPPHYLHGRSSSVSPPICSEICLPIGMNKQQQQHSQYNYRDISKDTLKSRINISPSQRQHHLHHDRHHSSSLHRVQRYMPYQLPFHQPSPYGFALGHSQPPPVSPAYSDSSYYSIRSVTPESTSSVTPEDLSVKNLSSSKASLLSPSKSSSSLLLSSLSSKLYHHDRENNNNNLNVNHNKINSSNNNITSAKVHQLADNEKEKSSPPRYQCPDCNKSYSTFSGLTKHQQFHCPAVENNQTKKSFSCKDCDKTYVSLGALKMHIRTHTLPCKCTICGKAFSRPWLLQGHIRTHTGEKPFSCQHCHRAFADRSNLRAHLQTHSDIKKYSCATCSKTFSRMSLLTKHTEGGCPGNQISSSLSPQPSSPSSFLNCSS